MRRTLPYAFGLAALLALTGSECRPTAPSTWAGRAPAEAGLVQTLRVEPAEPRSGETIRVESALTNRGDHPVRATVVACGLGCGGELVLSDLPGTARCLSTSYERLIEPGESVTYVDLKVVTSAPGTYVLEVTHRIGATPARLTVRVID